MNGWQKKMELADKKGKEWQNEETGDQKKSMDPRIEACGLTERRRNAV